MGDRGRAAAGGHAAGVWWLNSSTIYALGLVGIAFIHIGFAVADGRPNVIAVESSVTFAFVLVAAAAVTGSPWLLVVGLAGHGSRTSGSIEPTSSAAHGGGRRSDDWIDALKPKLWQSGGGRCGQDPRALTGGALRPQPLEGSTTLGR